MHRAKHRAHGDAAVPATALIERLTVDPDRRPAVSGPRHGAPVSPGGPGLFDVPGPAPAVGPGSLFGACRHARTAVTAAPAPPTPPPAPTGPGRPQPVVASLSVVALGAAAAVTAVAVPAAPPSAVETTGATVPVQRVVPAPVAPVAPALPVQAGPALPDQPTVQVDDLVRDVTARMASTPTAAVPYTTVAEKTALGAPAALRRAALTTAMGKLGKPYRWGAAGPNAFDCSGLIKWSFGKVGRSLPRTSRQMATVGTPVRRADLQPGDLVFFYKPISHVGIYLGNNKMVNASTSGQPVKISDISKMRFTTARRI